MDDGSTQRDSLTGLPNRLLLEKRLHQEIKNALLSRTPLTVALLEIDRFKQLDGYFGHPTGDAILRQTGLLLDAECSDEYFIGRHGWAKFALIFSNMSVDQARQVCERLGRCLESYDWSCVVSASLTVSIGSGVLPRRARGQLTKARRLLIAADNNLHTAKVTGRNRVKG